MFEHIIHWTEQLTPKDPWAADILLMTYLECISEPEQYLENDLRSEILYYIYSAQIRKLSPVEQRIAWAKLIIYREMYFSV